MIPQETVALILRFEGLDQPSKWPGGDSGITIGHGYDLGYCSAAEFARDWKDHLAPEDLDLLRSAIGKKAQDANAIKKRFSGIVITKEAARAVFATATIPKWEAQTRAAFPGVDKLPPRAFGALVSLVFNRGASMSGDRREEMRAIRAEIDVHSKRTAAYAKALLPRVLAEIAFQVSSMKRLWIGKGLDGLLARRDAEAEMIRNAANG